MKHTKKKLKHQAYFANKINIYEDKKLLRKSQKKFEEEREIQAHTHTDLRDENRREREREDRETGITVIRTVSSAYVE
jgi:hypothetical protein